MGHFELHADLRLHSLPSGGLRRKSRAGIDLRTGHKLGMGKEILLMFCVAKAGFPSGSKLGTEVLRMHELQTCEIPLLRRFSSTVWSAASAVHAMPAHLGDSPEAARSPCPSDPQCQQNFFTHPQIAIRHLLEPTRAVLRQRAGIATLAEGRLRVEAVWKRAEWGARSGQDSNRCTRAARRVWS